MENIENNIVKIHKDTKGRLRMITISLCMIVKNEEDVLARCLDSVRGVADEIIVVDTGSADHTKEIARRYTQKVYDFTWMDDFSAARNASFSQAEMDYCLWLDADDVLEEPARTALIQLKQTLLPSINAVMMRYDTMFDANGAPVFSYYRERLVRNGKGFTWTGAVHEVIRFDGEMRYADIAVTHRKTRPADPNRNMRIYEKQLAAGKVLEPRERFYYARELYDHGKYEKAARRLEEFLDSGEGWRENEIEACRQLAACYYHLKDERRAVASLFRSFLCDTPRAEICCDLGKYFLDRQKFQQAAYWYEQALSCPRRDCAGGFISVDCYGYIPLMQLCVCYDRMGNRELARQYNERAGQLKPNDDAYLYNKAFFEKQQAVQCHAGR